MHGRGWLAQVSCWPCLSPEHLVVAHVGQCMSGREDPSIGRSQPSQTGTPPHLVLSFGILYNSRPPSLLLGFCPSSPRLCHGRSLLVSVSAGPVPVCISDCLTACDLSCLRSPAKVVILSFIQLSSLLGGKQPPSPNFLRTKAWKHQTFFQGSNPPSQE